jgi:hypothetical protein
LNSSNSRPAPPPRKKTSATEEPEVSWRYTCPVNLTNASAIPYPRRKSWAQKKNKRETNC